MTQITRFEVDRNQLTDTQWCHDTLPTANALGAGQVLLKVDCFSFTANNITYAVVGDEVRYWEFFPASDDKGIIPVWGFAEVQASNCEGVAVGERLYGYYPMATHLIVEPTRITPTSFMDGAAHRKELATVYNQYLRTSQDNLYSAETEALQMLLRPLFTTSFLLDDFFADNQFFGANTVLLTSASSKTALGTAFLLHHNRNQRDHNYQIVGLTSASNRPFVESLGCYDKVLSYDQVTALDDQQATAMIDCAGNSDVLKQVHTHLDQQLAYSCLVGAAHREQRDALPKDLAGAKPLWFFAPDQAEKRTQEWGGRGFQTRLTTVWEAFIESTQNWIQVEQGGSPEAVERVYQAVLSGRFKPETGYILSLWEG